MIRTLLIDDERPARETLREKLLAHPEILVVGEAATVKTARALLGSTDYELVFLDIQLLGGSGFDLLPDVKPGARVIFVTAHDEHAVRAFEVNALDFLLKPVSAERLALTLTRVPQPVATVFRTDDLVHLSSGSSARFVPVAELSVIEANENYTYVHLVAGGRVLVRRTLKAWEDLLPPALFMRVHRAMLVNVGRVAGYQRDPQRAVTLQVQGRTDPVPVGRMFWRDVKLRLTGEDGSADDVAEGAE